MWKTTVYPILARLRAELKIKGISIEQAAQSIDMHRNGLDKSLKNGTITLRDYIRLCQAHQLDYRQIINRAYEDAQMGAAAEQMPVYRRTKKD